MPASKKANMVVPEVIAGMIQAELDKAIRFAALADVDQSLVGVAGDEVTVPAWQYVGDATDVAEGEAIPTSELKTATKKMPVKKAAKAVEITDEAMLSGLGDPVGEAGRQITLSIAAKADNDLLAALEEATQTSTATGGLTVANLDAAIAIFDDEDPEPMTLVASPAVIGKLLADAKEKLAYTEIGGEAIVTGALGKVSGAEIVRSKKVKTGEAYLVKRGALRLVLKREVNVETDRDILKKTTVITGDRHYGAYLYDPKKVVKITVA